MCAITGILDLSCCCPDAQGLLQDVSAMALSMVRRGPDDYGAWVDGDCGVALGHRRLSIIDLSCEGHQPMLSTAGRYALVYNGEVYNFPRLREELSAIGATFRGHSDTEIILAAVEHWGLQDTLERLRGMFALALWDRQEKELFLARDRIGIKPLYYGWHAGYFFFASELKAFKAHPAFKPEIDRAVLPLYMQHGYIPAPCSIYNGIYKLPQGCTLKICARSAKPADFSAHPSSGSDDAKHPVPYWVAADYVQQKHIACDMSYNEAVSCAEKLLYESVRMRMIADVPLGAFLSGGIDSSLIVSLMCRSSACAVKTFTIGFAESRYDEAAHAAEVARHLGTDHHHLYVTPDDCLDIIPQLADIYDEPFADSSQIPTCLLSRLTRKNVTVCLSGDGGDELFGGYNRYLYCRKLWGKFGWLPRSARKLAGVTAEILSGVKVMDKLSCLFSGHGNLSAYKFTEMLKRVGQSIDACDTLSLYGQFMRHWPEGIVLADFADTGGQYKSYLPGVHGSFLRQMMYCDLMTYHPDDILVKVDRASMAYGLEVRVPMIDHKLVEFSCGLPDSYLIHDGTGKSILRDILYRYVPRHIVDRPKKGFGVPIDSWLRGELREWAEDLLSPDLLRRQGFFSPEMIHKKWREHLEGKHDWHHLLWDVLMFQSWMANNFR